MAITRAKGVTLQEVSNSNASRSFHLGNLTSRDLLPIVAGCAGETFDLNTLSDKAYSPDKIAFQGQVIDIDLNKRTNYAASSIIKTPPILGDPASQQVIEEAFSNTITLGGFRNQINAKLDIGEFTTFSQKITDHADICCKVLEKVTMNVDNEMLKHIRGRYVTPNGQMLSLRFLEGDILVYSNGEDQVRVHKNDIAQGCLNFFSNRSQLTQKTTMPYQDIIQECKGPIFCNEMNSIISYAIEANKNQKGRVFHVGGQAAYSYINSSNFSDKFKKLVSILDDDNDITNGITYEGLEIVPAHFFRLVGYKNELIEALQGVFTSFDNLGDINTARSNLFRQGHTIDSDEVKQLLWQTATITNNQKLLFDTLLAQPEVVQMPRQTLKQGSLTEVYQSQLDMLYHMNQGFNPRESRKFITGISLDKIEMIMKKIISHHEGKK